GSTQTWAPELREMLSIDFVRKSGELKRKRDRGIADMDVDGADKVPTLDLEEDGLLHADEGVALGDSTLNQQSEIHVPGDEQFHEGHAAGEDYSSDVDGGHHMDNYDDSTIMPSHPADSG